MAARLHPSACLVRPGIFTSTRGIKVANLTPGTVYSVRVRAIGGVTNYSDWSAAMTLMAT